MDAVDGAEAGFGKTEWENGARLRDVAEAAVPAGLNPAMALDVGEDLPCPRAVDRLFGAPPKVKQALDHLTPSEQGKKNNNNAQRSINTKRKPPTHPPTHNPHVNLQTQHTTQKKHKHTTQNKFTNKSCCANTSGRSR